jgi:hypothetical protein
VVTRKRSGATPGVWLANALRGQHRLATVAEQVLLNQREGVRGKASNGTGADPAVKADASPKHLPDHIAMEVH